MTYRSQKPKNSFLKPELVRTDVPYAMTINPNDDYQYFKSNYINRVRTFQRTMDAVLYKHLSPCCKYDFRVEISSAGRLHLHGVIYISDVTHFYVTIPYYLQSMSSSEMDTISDPDVWYKYCHKQSGLFDDNARVCSHSVEDPADSMLEYVKNASTKMLYLNEENIAKQMKKDRKAPPVIIDYVEVKHKMQSALDYQDEDDKLGKIRQRLDTLSDDDF